ncbi:hypothetical protein PV721_36670 [Streptomyces sp. MB09-01]|uniref:hypothetical protein n=1 Tax=Streptomyces sp. MB09-01 TaxID=3028666 RepID=UPI0029B1AA34|nr:hypothetical protein [Streptomyces sp. MB09-01]MDX3539763.1 hypothetical protein [Streptomyces sp. MB09-01]
MDLATRAVERGVLGPGVIQDLEFSDDGSVLAVSLLQGTVTLWDGAGRRRLGGLSSTAATRGDDFGGRVAGLRFSRVDRDAYLAQIRSFVTDGSSPMARALHAEAGN